MRIGVWGRFRVGRNLLCQIIGADIQFQGFRYPDHESGSAGQFRHSPNVGRYESQIGVDSDFGSGDGSGGRVVMDQMQVMVLAIGTFCIGVQIGLHVGQRIARRLLDRLAAEFQKILKDRDKRDP